MLKPLGNPAFTFAALAHGGHRCGDHISRRLCWNEPQAGGIQVLEQVSSQPNSVLLGNLVIELTKVVAEAVFHHCEDAVVRHRSVLHVPLPLLLIRVSDIHESVMKLVVLSDLHI
ncbi:hypothetical protein FQV39_04760 [Bosea sp. F3-2]|uniref:hypothetical protein n=1 Tax=Bosea sp. F3-2 TaxID=2599640 RepID=UPI0011ED73E4|nr:hypothetical protein [Bosea sp. F3-2]QEL21963.1 hypothetical protein FQV39_04760 [Bosea sp. F3-2]